MSSQVKLFLKTTFIFELSDVEPSFGVEDDVLKPYPIAEEEEENEEDMPIEEKSIIQRETGELPHFTDCTSNCQMRRRVVR